MVSIGFQPYRLTFRRPFVTAAGILVTREGMVVRVADADGVVGFGEVAPLPMHGGETLADASRAVRMLAERLIRWLASREVAMPATPPGLALLSERMAAAAPDAPAARAGLDLALADLAARRSAVPLARWLNPAARPSVMVNAVIGAHTPAVAAHQASEAVAAGFRTVKVKLGTGDDEDLARVAAVRAAVASGVALRGDANGVWSGEHARIMLAKLAPFDLQYVEQPVPAGDIAALARLRGESPVRVAADEALLLGGGAEAVLDQAAADVLVLKPSLLGGPSAAWSLAERGRAAGMAVVVTSALEGAVGRMGALHVAAALPDLDLACGLATGDIFREDLAPTEAVREGNLRVPQGHGLGIVPGGG